MPGSRTTLRPTVEPCLFGFTITGNPSCPLHASADDGSHQPVRGRHARGAEQALGQILVHRRRARDVIAARVREAREIEHRLHAPVLAGAAVQREEHDVHLGWIDRQSPDSRSAPPRNVAML